VLVLHLMRRDDASTFENARTYTKVLTDGLAGDSTITASTSIWLVLATMTMRARFAITSDKNTNR
jgi:hypothetical protein